MAKLQFARLASNNPILRVFIPDITSTSGGGLTGLDTSSSGLRLDVIRELDSAVTSYTVASSNLETITTIGTYAAPTASKARFKAVDGTAMPGVYEIHLAQALLGTGDGSRFLTGMLRGATNMPVVLFEVQLTATNQQDAAAGGMTNLDAAVTSRASQTSVDTVAGYVDTEVAAILAAVDTEVGDIKAKTDQLVFTGANKVDASVRDWLGTAPATPLTAGVPVVDLRTFLRVGTAQGGAPTTITLDSGASSSNFFYMRHLIYIIGGTGAGQAARLITGYVGSTKVATVTPGWVVQPNSTSVFLIADGALADVEGWSSVAPTGLSPDGYVGADLQTWRFNQPLDLNADGAVKVDVVDWLDDPVETPTNPGVPEVDATYWLGDPVEPPANAGVPEVDVTHWVSGAVPSPNQTGVPKVDPTYWRGGLIPAGIETGVPVVDTWYVMGAIWNEVAALYGSQLQDGHTANTAKLGDHDSDEDDVYIGCMLVLIGDPSSAMGARQVRSIVDYDGATHIATVEPPWDTIPGDFNVGYLILPGVSPWDGTTVNHQKPGSFGQGSQALRTGAVASATSTTIVLDGGASASDDEYNGLLVLIMSGLGRGQFRYISDYVGSTKTCTVDAWGTQPDNTSRYVLIGF